jgi:hypothetical protein
MKISPVEHETPAAVNNEILSAATLLSLSKSLEKIL